MYIEVAVKEILEILEILRRNAWSYTLGNLCVCNLKRKVNSPMGIFLGVA